MIALLLSTVVASSSVVEIPDATAHEVTIQAIIRIPKLGAKDLAKLQIIVKAIPKQTEDYARREMLVVTSGQPVQCQLTNDVIRISASVQPDNVAAGLSLMESLVRKASLFQENLDAAASEIERPDYWSAALNPIEYPAVKLGPDEAQALYHRVIRPENLMLAVGGKIVPGDAQDKWERRMEAWNPGPKPKGYFDESAPTQLLHNTSAVSVITLAGTSIPSGDAALSTEALAMFALGSGKGASLFRVVREKHGWSYRQEAVLLPTLDGWQPQIVIAMKPTDDISQKVETIKSDLMEDVKNWNAADLARALGMASAVLDRNVPFSPLYVLGNSPAGTSLEDRTFLAGYWMMKTGKPWSPMGMLESMSHVTLEDLKDQATGILNGATVRILPGN